MEAGKGEFSSLFLHPILARDRIHPQPPLQDPAFAHLNPILEIGRQVAPTHNLDLTRGILRPQPVEAGGHLRHRCLVVLRVAHLGRLKHFHLKQTVIHALFRWESLPS
jgi:hypothetical protein